MRHVRRMRWIVPGAFGSSTRSPSMSSDRRARQPRRQPEAEREVGGLVAVDLDLDHHRVGPAHRPHRAVVGLAGVAGSRLEAVWRDA